jgi:hypothetical protein
MEKRLLLAFVLSALIFAGWSVIFPPPAPPTAPPQSGVIVQEEVGEAGSPPEEPVDSAPTVSAL